MSLQMPPGEQVILSMSVLKAGVPKPEESFPLWARLNLESRDVPATRYKIGWTRLVIPCEYERILGQLRKWRAEAANGGISEMPIDHPLYAYRDCALPEQVAEMILSTPDVSKTHVGFVAEVQMLDCDSQQDAFFRQFDPGHQSAAVSNQDRTIFLFRPKQGWLSERQYLHEWWHQVKWNCPEHSYRFGLASYLERGGFFADQYSRLSEDENWACHASSELCSENLGRATAFAHRAPLRTTCILMAGHEILDSFADLNNLNAQQKILGRNIEVLLGSAVEKSRATLVGLINNSSELEEVQAAVKLLMEIGSADDLAAITRAVELIEFQNTRLLPRSVQYLTLLHEVHHLKLRCIQLEDFNAWRKLADVRGLQSLTLDSIEIDDYDLCRLALALRDVQTFQRLELINHYPDLSERTRSALESLERRNRDSGI